MENKKQTKLERLEMFFDNHRMAFKVAAKVIVILVMWLMIKSLSKDITMESYQAFMTLIDTDGGIELVLAVSILAIMTYFLLEAIFQSINYLMEVIPTWLKTKKTSH